MRRGIPVGKKSPALVRLLMAIGFLAFACSCALSNGLVRAAAADDVGVVAPVAESAKNDEPIAAEAKEPSSEEEIAAAAAEDEAQTNEAEKEQEEEVDDGLVPVYLSERRLRSLIDNMNKDLRQMKREFIEDATSLYLRVDETKKIDRAALERGRIPAVAAHLASEEFAEILIKKHATERRLLSGLKAAFVKLLPLGTIKRLMAKFNSYRWLRGAHHYDLTPRFQGVGQLQLVQIYEMLELRARLRAADDVLTLTSDHIKRILSVAQDFLIENKYSLDSTDRELAAMAEVLPEMLQYYLNQVVYARANVARAYEEKLVCIGDVTAMAGGEQDFLKLIDEIIDTIGLDIDLNQEANSLELPPTINEDIIANVERKWIPRAMLDSIRTERELLLKHRRHTQRFLDFDGDKYDNDLANWLDKMYKTIVDRSYN